MRKLFANIGIFLEKVFPIVLLTFSIYIYKEILEENKRLSDKVESLTSLVSYKTSEIIEMTKKGGKPSEK